MALCLIIFSLFYGKKNEATNYRNNILHALEAYYLLKFFVTNFTSILSFAEKVHCLLRVITELVLLYIYYSMLHFHNCAARKMENVLGEKKVV